MQEELIYSIILIFLLVILLGFAYTIYIMLFMWSVTHTRPIGLLRMKNVSREQVARIKKEWIKSPTGNQYHLLCIGEDVDFKVLNGPLTKELK